MKNLLCLGIIICFLFGCANDSNVTVENDTETVGAKLLKKKKIEVEIEFFNGVGTTVTNASGIFYTFNGITIQENKVYPEEYWGTYPLYFFGQETGIRINFKTLVGNNKKYVVRTEVYGLNTDGSNGGVYLAPTDQKIVLKKNETLVLDRSFTAVFDSSIHESGLDRLIVTVFKVADDGSLGKIVAKKEGIYCPPEIQ